MHAADAAAGVDSKQRCLRRLLDRVRHEPVIVFTEYRDTLLQLAAGLPPSLQLHGGLTAAERACGAGAVQRRRRAPAGDRRGGGGTQPSAAVPAGRELRAPLEPGAARTTDRPRRSHRPAAHRPRHHARRPRHRRGSRHRQPRAAARPDRRDAGREGPARRVPQRRADGPHGDRGRARTGRRAAGAPAVVSTAPAVGDEARAAADRLSAGRRSRGLHSPGAMRIVLVSTLRATPAVLSSGFVVAIRCAARTEDGEVVATRVILVHAARDVARPPTPAAARAMAAGAVARPAGPAGASPVCAPGSRPRSKIHERSIDGRRAREAAMRDQRTANAPIQPGLFDRRALREAEELLRRRSRDSRGTPPAASSALDRARRPRLSCTPVAVLVVWR